MECCVIGTGYVGLVTGACLADLGHTVLCVDRDGEKIEALSAGRVPIYEEGLEALVKKNLESGDLGFTTDIQEALSLYTSDAADDLLCVDLGGRRIIKKK